MNRLLLTGSKRAGRSRSGRITSGASFVAVDGTRQLLWCVFREGTRFRRGHAGVPGLRTSLTEASVSISIYYFLILLAFWRLVYDMYSFLGVYDTMLMLERYVVCVVHVALVRRRPWPEYSSAMDHESITPLAHLAVSPSHRLAVVNDGAGTAIQPTSKCDT